MEHAEMVTLIRQGVPEAGGTWADLGAGTGNFTRALGELLGPQATIYAVDRDARALERQRAERAAIAGALHVLQADVSRRLDLPPLDGVLMANLLHFQRDQAGLLGRVYDLLRPGGRLLLVEYDMKLPVPWVPFPVPPTRFAELARQAGFIGHSEVGVRSSPSSGREMYAAAARKPGAGE